MSLYEIVKLLEKIHDYAFAILLIVLPIAFYRVIRKKLEGIGRIVGDCLAVVWFVYMFTKMMMLFVIK